MHLYQLKLVMNGNKIDEFIDCMNSLLPGFRKEKGCLGLRLYGDMEVENTYIVIGKWRTRQAMEKHFKGNDFSILTGAAKVLGETFEINIGEIFEKESINLAREKPIS